MIIIEFYCADSVANETTNKQTEKNYILYMERGIESKMGLGITGQRCVLYALSWAYHQRVYVTKKNTQKMIKIYNEIVIALRPIVDLMNEKQNAKNKMERRNFSGV